MAGDNKELEQAMIEKYGKVDMAVVEVSKAEVLYPICGKHNTGDEISVSKYAKGVGVTLDVGREYLVITYQYEEDGKTYYRPIAGQIGVFDINDDFTLVSQASAYTAAKYDGLSLADTAHDLKTMFENAKSE